MVFPKFIIEEDSELGNCLIIAKCTYHKQLATFEDKVKGGGWWIRKGDEFTLHGKSEDFGEADFDTIKECILKGNVYSNKSLSMKLDNFKFKYKNIYGEIVEIN